MNPLVKKNLMAPSHTERVVLTEIPQAERHYAPYATGTDSPLDLIQYLRSIFRQQLGLILLTTLLALALATAYVVTAPKTYTARATMIFDRGKVQAQLGGMSREFPVDTADLTSQLQLIKSETVVRAVVKKLNLADDREFTGPQPGLVNRIRDFASTLLSREVSPAEQDSVRAATASVAGRLTINQLGGDVFEIEFWSLNPARAAEVANTFADAYVEDQLHSRFLAAQQAATWLEDRIRELGEQSSAADEKVVQFKAKNNIVAAGGKLINEQQLAELNTQLVTAREKTSETRARLNRIETIINADPVDQQESGTVSDTLNNPIIVKLRSQYLELSNRYAEWSRRFGKDHQAVTNLARQIRELRDSIAAELRQIAETYKSDYEIAKQRQNEIERTIDNLVAQSQETNQAQIELRQLESSADTYRGILKSALQRNSELLQQQTFPGTEARLITRATAPTSNSSPKTLAILAASTLGGLMLGFGIGILRTSLDTVIRTPQQAEAALQAPCLALIPKVRCSRAESRTSGAASETAQDELPLRTIIRNASPSWLVIDRPLSRFAEAVRSIKSAADLNGQPIKVFGFTSSLPNEGKTTVAAAFALHLAKTGARTILVDCDLRRPALTGVLAPDAEYGILEVIGGRRPLNKALWTEPTTNLSFLPGALRPRLAHSSEVLASAPLRALFDELRQDYECIVVDLPPLAPIVDVRSTTSLIDSYVLIVEWGATKTEVAELALGTAGMVHENLLGVVLNKVNFKVLRRYEGRRGDFYSDKYYAHYGDDRPV